VSALELTAACLGHVRDAIVERSNLEVSPDEPLEAMVAVPANSSTRQRYLTLEAFSRAGFKVIGLVSEPTAAAIEYAHRNRSVVTRRSPKRYVVVYDLGGGTFDTSAVSLAERRFELLCNEGIAELGGNDFDQIILEMAAEQAGFDLHAVARGRRARMLEICREAKEALTTTSRRLLIDFGDLLGHNTSIVLDAADVYRRSEPLIDRTTELVARVFERLEQHGIDPENPRELGAIYLVGGATAYTPVARTLRALYKRKILIAPEPAAATAIGLAIAADADSALFVREAVTRHFGVWRESDGGREKVFDPIFAKNARIDAPLSAERRYRPAHAVGRLRYFECSVLDDEGCPAGDLMPWGEVLFPYDPALENSTSLSGTEARRPDLASEEIVEQYRYLPDGRVEVEIANCSRGYRRRYVVGRTADV
jgi:molecular chaperone DnaK (HSP70)